MKKLLSLLLVLLLLIGCSNNNEPKPTEEDNETETTQPDPEPTPTTSEVIDVYTRDSASGTREAFESGVGLEKGALTQEAVETSGNGDMAQKVGSDAKAIGYVSLTTDFEANNLKPVNFDGVEPTIENVLSHDYTLSRPFSFVTRASDDYEDDTVRDVVHSFLDFIHNSNEGLDAVEAKGGIVDKSDAKPWSELAANHPVLDEDVSSVTIRTAGSTSVEATLSSALEAFQAETGVQFVMNHTGSSDGFKRVLGDEKDTANAADIGFASRPFKTDGSEDVDASMESGYYCLDAVVVVVSKDNTIAPSSLTAEQVVSIFDGSVKNWEDIK